MAATAASGTNTSVSTAGPIAAGATIILPSCDAASGRELAAASSAKPRTVSSGTAIWRLSTPRAVIVQTSIRSERQTIFTMATFATVGGAASGVSGNAAPALYSEKRN